jgi:parvulin-like peptidyl-prolyl isomerase
MVWIVAQCAYTTSPIKLVLIFFRDFREFRSFIYQLNANIKKDIMKITVNEEVITDNLINQEIKNWQKQNPSTDTAAAFEHVSTKIIDWTLIRQAAEKQITVSPDEVEAEFESVCQQHGGQDAFLKRFGLKPDAVGAVKEDMKRQRQSRLFLDGIASKANHPEASQIEDYFKTHGDAFKKPETVHAAHIVKHPQGEAAENAAAAELTGIRKRLLDGEDFLTVAGETSECHDSKPDLGVFARGKMVPEFELVVFSMNPGEISPVFKPPFGLHIATVLERNEPSAMNFEEAKPHIKTALLKESQNETIRKWLETQKETATIEIEPPA